MPKLKTVNIVVTCNNDMNQFKYEKQEMVVNEFPFVM